MRAKELQSTRSWVKSSHTIACNSKRIQEPLTKIVRTIAAVCVQLTGAQMASGNSGKGRATTEESRNFEGLNLLFLSDTSEILLFGLLRKNNGKKCSFRFSL